MKNGFLSILMFSPIIIFAQGIHFQESMNWEQIKVKAKAENKYIFMDCFATWCVPCRVMEKQVYSLDSVGSFMNENFISVKVQMDSSGKDDPYTKSWYREAWTINQQFQINALPTYLFFSPAGQIVHREVGKKEPGEFLGISGDALNPQKQFYTLYNSYLKGSRNYRVYPYMARMAKKYNDSAKAFRIARDYIHEYLNHLNEKTFCTSENLEFCAEFVDAVTSKDKGFQMCYKRSALVDSTLPGNNMDGLPFSERFVNYVIYKEEVLSQIDLATKNGKTPDWISIKNRLKQKYNIMLAEINLSEGQMNWYKMKNDSIKYASYLVINVELKGPLKVPQDMWGAFYLNNNAWTIFQYTSDQSNLKKALAWSQYAVKIDSSDLQTGNMDTEANILYRLGRTEEAIQLEELVVQRVEENAKKENKEPDKAYFATLEKMKNGIPTWK